MLELLSLVGGGIFRMIPSVIELISKRQDHAHELAMLDRQMQLESLKWQAKAAEITLQSEAAEAAKWAEALPAAQVTVKSGVKWIDAINASVRPALTYWWCLGLYSAYKGVTVWVAIDESAPLEQIATTLMTEFDRSVIGSIIGFWFLDRALRKLSK